MPHLYEAPRVELPEKPSAGFRDVSVKCFQSIVSIVQYICPVHLDLHAIQRSQGKESEALYVSYPVHAFRERAFRALFLFTVSDFGS